VPWRILHSTRGLAAFARRIAMADLFIAGSTGPLHIAGALDVPTAAFYTRRRSATALRWQTLNSPGRRLAFSPPPDAGQEDMGAVDVAAAAGRISQVFLGAGPQGRPQDASRLRL
jgi:ADP-heptose:LPS heptosyltransferase